MIAYIGEFAIRDGGKERQARIVLTAQGEGDTPSYSHLVFGSSPVVLTWEECSLTDVIHRSQLQLNLIAMDDGDYRDIMDSLEQVYCMLQTKDDDGFWRPWWVGAYASTTWLEPFSRERKYEVQLTFSDFGYLERLDYDGNRFGCTGAVTVSGILAWIAQKIAGYAIVPEVQWMPLSTVQFNGRRFRDLIVRDVLFTEEDGSPRNVLDILTDVLEPANVHVMQHGGRIYLFRPDWETAEEAYKPGAVAIEAAGTDAEMESCEIYRRMELRFDPSYNYDIGFTVDTKNFIPVTQAFYYNGSTFLYADDNPDICRALCYRVGKSNEMMYLLWMSTIYQLHWMPQKPLSPTESQSLEDIAYEYPVRINLVEFVSAISFGSPELYVTAKVWATFDRLNAGTSLGRVTVRYFLTFIALDGSKQYYYSKAHWFNDPAWYDTPPGDDDWGILASWDGSNSDYDATVELQARVPTSSLGNGVCEVLFQFNTLSFKDGAVGYYTDSKVIAVGLCGISVEYKENFFANFDLSQHVDKELSPTASDIFSKTFNMGVLKDIAKPDSLKAFISSDSTVTDGETFLDHYADFLEQNYKVSESSPVRKRVRGSYSYPHMAAAFPVFPANRSVPLYTLQRDDRVFFLMSEQWDLKTGISQLVLEEANIIVPEPADGIYIYPKSLPVPEYGGHVSISLVSSADWDSEVSDPQHMGVTVSPSNGGAGREKLTVAMKRAAREDKTAFVRFTTGRKSESLSLYQYGKQIAYGDFSDIRLEEAGQMVVTEMITNADSIRIDCGAGLSDRLGHGMISVEGGSDYHYPFPRIMTADICTLSEGAKYVLMTLYFAEGLKNVSGTVTVTAIFGDEEKTIGMFNITE